jgi:guanylate kinase
MPGQLFIVAAPSGAGKTSLVKALLEADPSMRVSVSHTTRAPRPGEIDGVHYHFVSHEKFAGMITAGEFLEHALVHGDRKGTSKMAVQQHLDLGRDVVLEIDWQGARQIRPLFVDCVSVFILPPSRDTLLERMKKRGQDSAEVMQKRMHNAREEMSHCSEFDYIIVNDRFEWALVELRAIVTASRLKQKTQSKRYADLIGLLLAQP